MAVPGPKYKGWRFDPSNDRLDIYYEGTRIGQVDANGLTVASGGVTVSAGGVTVSAGGVTISTGALTVSDTSAAHSIDGTDLSMPNLPTSDPSVAGQLWSNSGVVTVSAGA